MNSDSNPAGYTRISRVALNRLLTAVTAETFGLRPGQVNAQAKDDDGKLAVAVSLPLPVPPLRELAQGEDSSAQFGGDLISRVSSARQQLSERATQLTGSELGRIDIEVNDAVVDSRQPRVLVQ